MYNFNHKITYNHVSEIKQNKQYQKDILTCFSIDTYDYKKIGKSRRNI